MASMASPPNSPLPANSPPTAVFEIRRVHPRGLGSPGRFPDGVEFPVDVFCVASGRPATEVSS